jgi:hypothetical protein
MTATEIKEKAKKVQDKLPFGDDVYWLAEIALQLAIANEINEDRLHVEEHKP